MYFAENGLIGRNSVFTHMNVLTDAEVEAIVHSGMALVWHPGNYMYYGIAPNHPSRFPELHKRGISIAFGTDVAKAWAFGELGFIAYLVSREWGHYLPSEFILEMFTLGGARAMGAEKDLGSIEPGKRADIVIRSSDLPRRTAERAAGEATDAGEPYEGRRHGDLQRRGRRAPRRSDTPRRE